MAKARTVLGDIDVEELGFTYTHEHLFCVPPANQPDRDFELSDYDCSLYELNEFKKVGGKTLVEGSTIDYGRNPEAYRRMSKSTGVNVICTTGFNKYRYYQEWVKESTVEDLAAYMIRDIEEGCYGTDIKAGQIKTGGSYNVLHPDEVKVTHACALAHLKTGAPLWCHTEYGTMGNEIVKIYESHGIDPSKIVVGHSDRNCDPEYLLELASHGVYVGFDGCGKIKYYPDSTRIEMLKILKEHGYVNRIMISGDMGRASYLKGYGGGPGFAYIATKFIPRMLRNGFTQDEIDQIFIRNPKNWLGQF